MKSAVLALGLVLGLAACSELVTSDQSGVRSPGYGVSGDNPPPPPIDLEAAGEIGGGAFAISASRSVGTSTQSVQVANAPDFVLNVTYFYNKPGNSGFLQVGNKQGGGAQVSNAARARSQNGKFSGNGVVEVATSGGTLTFDLANISQQSSVFGDCRPFAQPPQHHEVNCFRVVINGATLGDIRVSVVLQPA
ncbi:MAG: hypothetical protein M3R07_05220 [Gemmatimonadota bacterium]|nr:hypothetical protein [Gemmatimonadota bacterium]